MEWRIGRPEVEYWCGSMIEGAHPVSDRATVLGIDQTGISKLSRYQVVTLLVKVSMKLLCSTLEN
uniref:Uncharacterized protein n=1 Tax=Physcomitrium patens TaxID=3218 RepID=A0A2K1IAN7_PHYPA|nr:hypothetical protein PHYPA_030911 [Physcomitrium patens]